MGKSVQFRDTNGDKCYAHPYYPVGSIYLSVVDINPSQWFGGTWEKIAKGRTLVGVDENDGDFTPVKKTGGSKTNKLEFDNYRHNVWSAEQSNKNDLNHTWMPSGNNYGLGLKYTSNTNTPVNNLQPYFTCYIWCRTA